MLRTELSTILAMVFAAVALAVAVFSYRASRQAQRNALALAEWTRENNEKSVSLKRMAEVEGALTDLTDSYQSLLRQHKRLRSRISMRKARETGNQDDQDLHSESDKNALRLKAKAAGLLR